MPYPIWWKQRYERLQHGIEVLGQNVLVEGVRVISDPVDEAETDEIEALARCVEALEPFNQTDDTSQLERMMAYLNDRFLGASV